MEGKNWTQKKTFAENKSFYKNFSLHSIIIQTQNLLLYYTSTYTVKSSDCVLDNC